MEIRALKESEDLMWERFMQDRATSLYDAKPWQSALLETFPSIRNHKCIVADANNIVAGISLFEVKSLVFGHKLTNAPFKMPCSVFIDTEQCMCFFIEWIMEAARERGVDSVNLTLPSNKFDTVLKKFGFDQYRDYYYPVMGLRETYGESFNRFKERTNLRKIVRTIEHDTNYEFVRSSSRECLEEFYKLLVRQNKIKYSNIPPPFRLLEALRSKQAGNMAVYALRHHNDMVAGDLLLFHGDTVYSCWRAVDLRFQGRSVGTYLHDRIIRSFYRDNPGIRIFDLGFVSRHNKSLFYFKSKWGCEFHQPFTYVLELKRSQRRGSVNSWTRYRNLRPLMQLVPAKLIARISDCFYGELA